ncbi:hypothetical protein EBB06_03025 [Crenobacter cavernae]|uniref:Uncharacterized protein n=1 Tax=Crenobacter cavernae TaxID=2290923 RepID=A0ABY0FEZ8_9NEIS|nr:hypothetical protein EBB06_03025 [Crenobacter cavernae]
MLAGAAALFALLKWGRLPLATPGYQGVPVTAMLVWLHLKLPGRSAALAAATLASAALWLATPQMAAKALALVAVASVYGLAAGAAPSRSRVVVAAALAYGIWPLAAWLPKAATVNGQGLLALCGAHAAFGAIGALIACALVSRRPAEPASGLA